MVASSLAPPDGNVVEFDRVGKLYPRGGVGGRPLTALADVTLQIRRGQVLGLLGPNRAGKTTLLKVLLSVTQASEGRVTRFGRPEGDRSVLGRIGYVHENHAFPRYLSATELLHFYGRLGGAEKNELRDRVPSLLERVGLDDRAREPLGRFSKGMVQRLGLAQALVNNPDLLVLDEPTEGLDFEGRRAIRTLVDELKRDGKTIILVSHVLTEVEQLCDHLAVLNRGRLIFDGPTTELVGSKKQPLEAALEALYGKAAGR